VKTQATSTEVGERRVLSQKELAKEKRHAMYQRAKEQRATDPRYLAMKEAAKVQRREVYQKVKASRKAATADKKAQQKAEQAVQRADRRKQAQQELFVAWVFKGSAQND
jgi:hypothetical protein